MERVLWRACVFAVLLCSLASLASGTASAAEYKAPTEPFTEPPLVAAATCGSAVAAYEGSEEVVKRVRESSVLVRNLCVNERELQEQDAHRLWWVTDELVQVADKIDGLREADFEQLAESRSKLENLEGDVKESGEATAAATNHLRAFLEEDPHFVTSCESGCGGELGAGETVSVSDPEGTAATIEAVESGDEALKSAIWFVAGVGAAAVAGYAFYRLGVVRS